MAGAAGFNYTLNLEMILIKIVIGSFPGRMVAAVRGNVHIMQFVAFADAARVSATNDQNPPSTRLCDDSCRVVHQQWWCAVHTHTPTEPTEREQKKMGSKSNCRCNCIHWMCSGTPWLCPTAPVQCAMEFNNL